MTNTTDRSMIRLTCTQCKSVLEMDDAFAGGVCRCQYCGTIQTVPSHLKGSAAPAGAATGAKRLYQGGNGAAVGARGSGAGGNGTGTGLDELADVVASSGLARSALRQGPASRTGAAAPQAGPNRVPLLAAAGAVILVLVAVIVWLATRSNNARTTGPNPPGTTGGAGNPDSRSQGAPSGTASATGQGGGPTVGNPGTPAGPHYQSVRISASRIVYVIDRGGSARDFFDPVKASVFNSLDSLGPDREFAVVFWAPAENPEWPRLSYPHDTWRFVRATPEKIQECRGWFADLGASGRTEPAPAVQRAAELKPDAIFLITAKGSDLEPATVGAVQQALGASHPKVYTIDLTNGGDGKSILEPLATQTGGSYTRIAPAELR